MGKFKGRHKFPAQNACIYCGSVSYEESSGRQLGDEHTIPEAVGGIFVLPNAACRNCETTINSAEMALYRGGFLSVRKHFGFKGKKRASKHQKHTVPIFDCSVEGETKRIEIPASEYPGILLLCVPPPPKLINPNWQPIGDIWSHWVNATSLQTVNDELPSVAVKHGLRSFALASTDSLAHARALAKIAHSNAIGLLGREFFSPLLIDFILGRENSRCYELFGRSLISASIEMQAHAVRFREVVSNGTRYLVAEVRLFACLNSPSFDLVTGIVKPNQKLLNNAEVTQGAPPGFDMIIGPDQSFDPRTHKLLRGLPKVSATGIELTDPSQWFRVRIDFQ